MLTFRFTSASPVTTGKDITIQAEGIGKNADEAMINAKRAAVEKGIGTIIQSETEIKNFMVNKDVIITRTSGAIKSFTKLSEHPSPESTITVKIEAVVSSEKIHDDLIALRVLLESMARPRVMILIRENNMQDSSASGNIAESELISYLTKKDFSIVDAATVEQLKKQEAVEQALNGNSSSAAAIGLQAGAEVVITGTSVSRVADALNGSLGGMKSCQADVAIKIINCANGSIISAKMEHAAVVHINPVSGGAKAITDAITRLFEKHLFEELLSSWQFILNNGIPLRVIVSNVKSFKTSKALLNEMPMHNNNIVKVTKREWNQTTGIMELEVVYKGNSDGFCESMDSKKLSDNTTISVTGSNSGSVKLKVE
jgi:hypothetical protein